VLEHQLEEIRNRFTADVLSATNFTIGQANKQVTLNLSGGTTINYIFTSEGTLERGTQILSQNIDFRQSHFTTRWAAVVMNIFLRDNILGRELNLNTSIQTFPRRSR
jgi:5-methylthioribose kinase